MIDIHLAQTILLLVTLVTKRLDSWRKATEVLQNSLTHCLCAQFHNVVLHHKYISQVHTDRGHLYMV